MSNFFSEKNIFFKICLLAFCALMFNSCAETKKQEETTVPADILISEEDYNYLEGTIDFMELITMLKMNGAIYNDNIAKPELYDRAADRKKLLMRFGMLTTDIAYARIIGNKTQMPDYDKLFQRYLNELGLVDIIKTDFTNYFDIIANNELNDSLFQELKERFRKDRVELINNIKNKDDDFLIYYSIGIEVEMMYLFSPMFKIDTTLSKLKNFHEYAHTNGNPICKIYYQIWSKEYTNPRFQEYKEYADKLKPGYELMYDKLINAATYSKKEVDKVLSVFSAMREDILR